MDWMFCKKKKKRTVECFQFVLPLFVHPRYQFTVLVVCLEGKNHCQIHSAHILYFSQKEKKSLRSCVKPPQHS